MILSTKQTSYSALWAILLGPGIAVLLKRSRSVKRIGSAILNSLINSPAQKPRSVLRNEHGVVIPRRFPLAICFAVAQIFFVASFLLILRLDVQINSVDRLTFPSSIVSAIAAVAMFFAQYRLVSGNEEEIDRGIEALLGSGSWIVTSDVLPSTLSELRSDNAMQKKRLGVSIETITPEEIQSAVGEIEKKAAELGMSTDEYCATGFHRRNGLNPEKCNYMQADSLAKTLSED